MRKGRETTSVNNSQKLLVFHFCFFLFVSGMRDFSISCKYLENIRSLSEEFPEYRDRTFTIIINETFKIEVPLIVASSFSSSITKTVKNDPTASELHVRLNTNTQNTQNKDNKEKTHETLNKIKSVLCGNTKVSLNEESEFYTFASFGLSIGNEDFVSPLRTLLSREVSNVEENNVVSILRSKQTFEFSLQEMEEEISFICTHFENMSTREDFIKFSRETRNSLIVESIISSDKLNMKDEDTLLTFVIRMNEERRMDNISTEFFKHVMFEYCSSRKCEEFVSFICSKLEEGKTKTLISCLGRRFTQSNIPMKPPFIEGRHQPKQEPEPELKLKPKIKITLIDKKDPLNGILRREHEKGNVLLEPSSKELDSDDVYSLLKADDKSWFYTESSPNSFIKASLKDGKTFILKSYMIRGSKLEDNQCQLKSWKLEGERASDGKLILLDSHNEDPTKALQVRTFDVSCEEQLKSVKLTQTGKNTKNDYALVINAFDVFGFLCE